eukprot:TRINITY_DN15885_c0_g2_i1.p1 TRINITY_DN15885_c0_g2~~TRINITY_DN15885_c0_g2_i1.p1  ORF type:complete len:149 (-),score=15.09 TRINITY_DN15885_c0_g2_i1:244-690(-)
MVSTCGARSISQIASTPIVTSSISSNSTSMADNNHNPPIGTEKVECDGMAAGERRVIPSCFDEKFVQEVKRSEKAKVVAALCCYGNQGAEVYHGLSASRLATEQEFEKMTTAQTAAQLLITWRTYMNWGRLRHRRTAGTSTTTTSWLI